MTKSRKLCRKYDTALEREAPTLWNPLGAGVLALTHAGVDRRLHRQLRKPIPLGSLVFGEFGVRVEFHPFIAFAMNG